MQQAVGGIDAEVFVIDNNSTDGSLAYLQPIFPFVHFIANTNNPGFGKACNQGLAEAIGKYVLFLNPDTIIPADCIVKCINKLEEDPNIGALGVKMVNGEGVFLKESKRALPDALSSLYKLFGISALFPKSKIFSKYNLGYLNENEDHEVDVLCGAFMMIPKKVLNEVGGFDEAFLCMEKILTLAIAFRRRDIKTTTWQRQLLFILKEKAQTKPA
ncbi:glycosyltransferase [Niabella ginsengisoli]|uniref:Glycosyltransferase n=1 Tax=Niabella ginsengisoli TaxID=522298 RepID=A0ABS9SNV3_9BACT|nr:glycosyltransferase [Niabella ginsengisoli]